MLNLGGKEQRTLYGNNKRGVRYVSRVVEFRRQKREAHPTFPSLPFVYE
jgi:hypothetical protein